MAALLEPDGPLARRQDGQILHGQRLTVCACRDRDTAFQCVDELLVPCTSMQDRTGITDACDHREVGATCDPGTDSLASLLRRFLVVAPHGFLPEHDQPFLSVLNLSAMDSGGTVGATPPVNSSTKVRSM
jgi:hypothetical protein